LRQDIIDELGDHLACALRRELLKERVGEGEARKRVLSRFGDPAALVRRLWRDAIWEQVMSQRMLIGMCAVTVVLCVCVMGVSWAWVNQQSAMLTSWKESQEAQRTEQNALFQKLVDQSTASTTALAARVDKLSESAASVPSEWNPVEYEFRADGKEGPPVAGVKVSVSSSANEAGLPALSATSDEKGIVRFKRVRYGNYQAMMLMPSGPFLRRNFTLQLGESLKKIIPCPVTPTPEKREVRVRVHWPAELADRPLSVYIDSASIWRPVDGVDWGWDRNLQDGYRPDKLNLPHMTIFDSQGDLIELRNGLRDITNPGRQAPSWPAEGVTIEEEPSAPHPEPEVHLLTWPGPGFEIHFLAVLSRLEDRDDQSQVGSRIVTRKKRRFGAIKLSAADWKAEVEDGETPTLWLTPTPEAIEKITADLQTVEQLEQKLLEWEGRRKPRRSDAKPDDKTGESVPAPEGSKG
jgi:hypothetical protein